MEVWADFMGKLVLTISLPPPNDKNAQSVNNFSSCLLDNQWAMQLHQPMITVSAAFMSQNATDHIATTS